MHEFSLPVTVLSDLVVRCQNGRGEYKALIRDVLEPGTKVEQPLTKR